MDDSGKKKLLMIAGAIIGLIILIVIILLLFHAVTGKKKLSYSELENKILTAAKSYYSDKESALPKENGDQVSVTDSVLTSEGYIKPINELTSSKSSCAATVYVTKTAGDYKYTVLLNCGTDYTQSTIADYIKNNVEKVTTGDGLYELNGELVYRGDAPNNFVQINKKMYRIVKIVDNNLILITDEKLYKTVWDDRFNIERSYQDGINDYSVSRIRDELTLVYNNEKAYSKKELEFFVPIDVYVGHRAEDEEINDGSIEKSEIIENENLGLLPLYDYINASIDVNCASSNDDSCQNYNYLSYYYYSWWTITGTTENTSRVFRINAGGEIELPNASSSAYIRPITKLTSAALYVSGTGTEEDPYIIK